MHLHHFNRLLLLVYFNNNNKLLLLLSLSNLLQQIPAGRIVCDTHRATDPTHSVGIPLFEI